MSGRTFRYHNTFKQRPVKSAADDDEDDQHDDEEEESVYYALCEDDRVGLARMLREGLDPNYTFNGSNQLGKTALHLCCEKGLKECAELFITVNAKINARDGWYQTPLMYAVCTERLDMVKMMMQAGANLNKRDRFGKTVLHFAVKHESMDCLKALLEGGADIDVGDALARTPLWLAASEDGNEKSMKCLLENDADVYLRDVREKRTPLQAALAHTEKDAMTYLHHLLQAGSPVNTLDEFGHTCVMTLLKRCYTEERDFTDVDKQKVHILLAAGHDINLLCEKETPALWYQFHDTALNLAIIKDLPIATDFLLEVGADPNKHGFFSIKNRRSVPPLVTAILENRLDVTRMLLRANCDMSVRVADSASQTTISVFRCALEHAHWEQVELLLQAGYDLSAETYLRTNVDVPDQLVLNLDFWSRLIDHITTPLPLLLQCREHVRRTLGHGLMGKVRELPLPTFLMDLLLLKHL